MRPATAAAMPALALLAACANPAPEIPLPDLGGAEAEIVSAVEEARAAVR
ncbi:MAG: hypothetical protein GTO30_16625, partial [Acidobacteria bacterium]|nr:hypothetical protein [Acidobacteriota bacterium]NIQ84119.1 hypothetical protein [Acidobacteriota bacterium]